jgi:hypothetical protein
VINRGIAAGELVVTSGADKLEQGTHVVVAAPTPAPAATPSTGDRS